MTSSAGLQPFWEEQFFAELAQTGLIKRSAAAAGVTTGPIYNRRKRNAAFARRVEEVLARVNGTTGADSKARAASPFSANQWKGAFLDALAETSNVSASAARAGVATRAVYDLRRTNTEFATQWRNALYEGYANLEMEVLGYLRDPSPTRKLDVANALRLLAAHKETIAREAAQRANVNAADVRASIARKVEALRQQVLAERKRKQT